MTQDLKVPIAYPRSNELQPGLRPRVVPRLRQTVRAPTCRAHRRALGRVIPIQPFLANIAVKSGAKPVSQASLRGTKTPRSRAPRRNNRTSARRLLRFRGEANVAKMECRAPVLQRRRRHQESSLETLSGDERAASVPCVKKGCVVDHTWASNSQIDRTVVLMHAPCIASSVPLIRADNGRGIAAARAASSRASASSDSAGTEAAGRARLARLAHR